MARKKKPFACETCGNNERFIWKTRCGMATKLLTTFAWVTIRQMQVQCSCCGHKFNITRPLLGLEALQRIFPEIRRKLGLLGALTSFRVAEKFMSTFGAAIDKMTIWQSVQKTGGGDRFCASPGHGFDA